MTRVRSADELRAELQVPALIVGAGACGLSAAIHLKDLGVEAWVLERDNVARGSTALSSGFIPAAGTAAQRAAGIADSSQDFAQDIQAKAHGQAAAHLVEAYTSAIAHAMNGLQAQHGFDWQVLEGFLYPGHRRHRMHTLPERQGQALIDRLQSRASTLDISIVTNAMVVDLYLDKNQRVAGVGVLRPDQSYEAIACEALLLACNGYGGDRMLARQHLGSMGEALFAGHQGNDGSAVKWGLALGAGLADMGACQGHGSWAIPHGILLTWALMIEGGVQLNMQGHRFHDETCGYSEAAPAVLAQTGAVAWCVFDEPIVQLARSFPDFLELEHGGGVLKAEDSGELAVRIGCSRDDIEATLAWDIGQNDAFGRRFKRRLQFPLYAVRVTGALFHTQGGLDIDAHCRVRKTDGATLPNLWAAGGAARGVSGGELSGYLSGNGLLSAIAGAWIAARDMAAFLGGSP